MVTIGDDDADDRCQIFPGNTLGDWSSDELHEALATADSRCQARLSHRMAGFAAVAEIELNGKRVKCCRQCADEIEILRAYSSKRVLPLD